MFLGTERNSVSATNYTLFSYVTVETAAKVYVVKLVFNGLNARNRKLGALKTLVCHFLSGVMFSALEKLRSFVFVIFPSNKQDANTCFSNNWRRLHMF